MTVGEWLTTPYFWIPFLLVVGLLVWCYYEEKRQRSKYCSECGSTSKRRRGTVRYWMSDYLYSDGPCESEWHNR